MFAGLDVAQAPPRRWTAVASFTLQAALLAAAIVYSTLYPQKLSEAFFRPPIFVPMPSGGVRPVRATQAAGQGGAHPLVTPIVVARDLTFHPANGSSRSNLVDAPPSIGMAGPGTGPGVDFVTPSENAQPLLAHPATPSRVVRTSSMMEGMLIRKVEPLYPAIARTARVEGSVKISAIIGRGGRIEQAQVLSGSPLLSAAALDAIRQWRYRPYLLNGEPVEVETQITFNFILGH